MMKNWSAIEWCLFILTLTIPLIIILLLILRLVTGQPLPEGSAEFIGDLLNMITGGVIGIIGTLFVKSKEK